MALFLEQNGLDYILKNIKGSHDKELKELKDNVDAQINNVQENLEKHKSDTENPHKVTKEQLGYSEADRHLHLDTLAQADHVDVKVEARDGFNNSNVASNIIPQATEETAGVLIPTDKTKLNKLVFDSNNKVDASILPSYVDDVIEGYYDNGNFYLEATHKTPINGETGKIYVDLGDDDHKIFRYVSTSDKYVSISDVPAATLNRITAVENEVVNQFGALTVTLNPWAIFKGVPTNVTATAQFKYRVKGKDTLTNVESGKLQWEGETMVDMSNKSSVAATTENTANSKAATATILYKNVTFTTTATIPLYDKVYHGGNSSTTLSAEQIKAMSIGAIGKPTSFSGKVTEGQYFYLATPGYTVKTMKEGGFDVPFESLSDVTITNDAGEDVQYHIYKSKNAFAAGNYNVTVSY